MRKLRSSRCPRAIALTVPTRSASDALPATIANCGFGSDIAGRNNCYRYQYITPPADPCPRPDCPLSGLTTTPCRWKSVTRACPVADGRRALSRNRAYDRSGCWTEGLLSPVIDAELVPPGALLALKSNAWPLACMVGFAKNLPEFAHAEGKMQRELLVGAALCFSAAIHMVQAAPITYDINFTTQLWDRTDKRCVYLRRDDNAFSVFTVLWDGFSIDATTAANMAPFATPAGASRGAPARSPQGSFDILSGFSTCPVRQQWVAIGRTGTSLSGVFSFLEYDPAIGGGVDFVADVHDAHIHRQLATTRKWLIHHHCDAGARRHSYASIGLLVMGLISPIAVHWSRRGNLRSIRCCGSIPGAKSPSDEQTPTTSNSESILSHFSRGPDSAFSDRCSHHSPGIVRDLFTAEKAGRCGVACAKCNLRSRILT